MKASSEKQISQLHQEFTLIKRYADKLSFYDRHFGIIPFVFPPFDPGLSLFFGMEKQAVLTRIIKLERNNPGLTEKSFSFKTVYRFNIKPTNSNNAIYSNYILSKFISLTPDFDSLLQPENKTGLKSQQQIAILEKANTLVNHIENKLLHEYDKSLLQHCMTVFYKGVHDGFTGSIVLPDKKRKFTELYLYAQGILYARFLALLRSYASQKKTGNSRSAPQTLAGGNFIESVRKH